MGILADANPIQIVIIAAAFFVFIFAVIAVAILGKYLRLWIQSVSSSAGIGIFDLLGMTFRKSIRGDRAEQDHGRAVGLGEDFGITTKALEAAYMAGGKVAAGDSSHHRGQ